MENAHPIPPSHTTSMGNQAILVYRYNDHYLQFTQEGSNGNMANNNEDLLAVVNSGVVPFTIHLLLKWEISYLIIIMKCLMSTTMLSRFNLMMGSHKTKILTTEMLLQWLIMYLHKYTLKLTKP